MASRSPGRPEPVIGRLAVTLVLVLVTAGCGPDGPRGSGPPAARVKLTQVATVEAPLAMAVRPGSSSIFVAEVTGRVRELRRGAPPPGEEEAPAPLALVDAPVLDISDQVVVEGEMGLLGLAFSPDGSRLYVVYSSADRTTRLVLYDMAGEQADPQSATELLAVPQPFIQHKSGQLAFGPDGLLYVGLGDGGAKNDPGNVAPDPNTLLGKVLRIDVSQPGPAAEPYAIPPTNPFAAGGGEPEIFLRGVRNPWRFSFDRLTGDLWIADVGESRMEEINFLFRGTGAGADLGWSGYEGTRINIPSRTRPDTLAPVFEYGHDLGCAVTGGYVYRGQRLRSCGAPTCTATSAPPPSGRCASTPAVR